MPAIGNLDVATQAEVDARLEELRGEFVSLEEGRRSNSATDIDAHDMALRAMRMEVNALDTWNTFAAARMHRERQNALVATYGPAVSEGLRTIGEAFLDKETIEALESGRSTGAATEVQIRLNGQIAKGKRTLVYEREIDGKDGKAMTRWLKAAGIIGGSRLGDPDGMRAVTEWGAAGPPTFDSTDSGGLIPRLGQPIPPVPRQAKLYLRDLLPTMPTTFPIIPYVRELNPTAYEQVASGGASTVAEGSVKPTAELSFVSENAPVTVIATTLTLSKQMFQDAPAVISYINQRLPYLVKLREDAEFLSGSGTWPDITGITNTPGIQSGAGLGGGFPDYAIEIGNAFALIEQQDGQPTAVVFNPINAWNMFTNRAAGGAGTFDAGTPFSMLPLTVWGIPTYRSRVYPTGSALVCDFERGAMIADREAVNLQTYNERYAEQNLVLLICEERLGLMVFRPDLFVEQTLS
jgi:hypothetical protein